MEEEFVVVVNVGGNMLGLVVWCKKKNVKLEVLAPVTVLVLARGVFDVVAMEGAGALSIVIMIQQPTLDIQDSF